MTELIHVMGSLSSRGAGVARAVWEMSAALATLENSALNIHLLGIADRDWTGSSPISNASRLNVQAFHSMGPSPPDYSPRLNKILRQIASASCLIHSHGLWLHPNWKAASFARRNRLPLVISPHGMLCPWSFQNSSWKKKPIFHLLEQRNLESAACLLASSERESCDIANFQFGNPIATIPFGLDMTEFAESADSEVAVGQSWDSFLAENPKLVHRRLILFLGRIHPVKAPEQLITAFGTALAAQDEFQLIFAGPVEPAQRQALTRLAHECSIQDRVTFAGAVSGSLRLALLRRSDALVLCSHNENFGYVVPEALASGTPVIASDRTPWAEVNAQGCGWCYPHGELGLASALSNMAVKTPDELYAMGVLGRRWIERDFTWNEVARKMLKMYRWILDGGSPPEFVKMPP